MPNCFALYRKADSSQPVPFAQIDDEMREAFHQPADPQKFLLGWYDLIGLALALGKTWDEMRGVFEDRRDDKIPVFDREPEIHDIIEYLEEHFVASSWYAPRL